MASVGSLIFLVALVALTALQLWLTHRQMKYVASHRAQVPAAFAQQISLQAHQRAADYTLAKGGVDVIETAVQAALLLGWTLLGGLAYLYALVQFLVPAGWGSLAGQMALLAAFGAVGALLDLPFAIWRVFGLEQKFGFNRITPRLFAVDLIKGWLLGAVLGLPIAALVLWLMQAEGPLWWLWAWAVWVGFNLLLMVVYPTLIAPIFNQFKPLADEALAARVQALMRRCGFQSKGIFVMDGSRRSAHANAYFTGLGAAKRVVFFDTLLAKLTPDEVDAVLAHELGHFAHRHIVQRLIVLFTLSGLGFWLLGQLANHASFYAALGVTPSITGPNSALALLLFAMVVPVVGGFVAPAMALWSRRHEFQADAYACAHASGAALSSALLKLHEDNASTLTPDPLYAALHYSHPPAVERLAAIGAMPSLGEIEASDHLNSDPTAQTTNTAQQPAQAPI